MLLEPTRVWLVRPGRREALPGILTLETGALTFTPRDQDDALPIPIGRIGRARRRRGTPILEVAYTDARAERAVLFLYFAPPPPLPGSAAEGRRRSAISWILPTRGLEQTSSAMSLRAASRVLKPRIERWVEAIRVAARG